MSMLRTMIVCLGLVMIPAWSVISSEPVAEGDPLTGPKLLAQLQNGGFNIYFRHAQTDWSQMDHVLSSADWVSCDPAQIRQLSDQGRETAARVGESMLSLIHI